MLSDRNMIAAFTGHRTYAGQASRQLAGLLQSLYGEGFRVFVNGMAVGFDLAAAEAVLALRDVCPDVKLVCAVPFPGQERRFSPGEQERYRAVLTRADRTEYVSECYFAGCYARRNDFLVRHASVLVAWYDGSPGGTRYTVGRALRQGLRVENLFAAPQQKLPGLF